MTLEQAALGERFAAVVGAPNVLTGAAIKDDYAHDEALTTTGQLPAAVVLPSSTDEVAAVLRLADEHRIPVTARGSGTGMSGACICTVAGKVTAGDHTIVLCSPLSAVQSPGQPLLYQRGSYKALS